MIPRKFRFIAGLDEAGRGPLAGPVVAACVCFRRLPDFTVRDSKKLSPQQRQTLFPKICNTAFYSFGLVDHRIVDSENILQATYSAFHKAIRKFLEKTNIAISDVVFLVDGPLFQTGLPIHARSIVDADDFIPEVSAASILAKVLRDRIMCGYDRLYPQWGFVRHKGYPTPEHYHAIEKNGFSRIHRRTFSCGQKPVKPEDFL